MYDEAALEFLSAYEARRFPEFLFNAAVCYEKARNYSRAVEFFKRYLDESPKARDREAVTARMEALAKLVPRVPLVGGGAASAPATQAASLPASAPAASPLPPLETKGLVVVESKPQGAFVYLDTKMKGPVGRTPWSGSLPAGDYKVLVEAKGYKPETRTIRPAGDRLLVLYMALSEEHYLGWLEIEANVPGVNVYVDKKEAGPVGRTPFSGFLKPGKHTIFLEREGYLPQQHTLEIERGKPHRLETRMELVPYGWIQVAVNKTARGTRVLIDGKEACKAPCRVEVTPGRHKVVLVHRDFKTTKTTVNVERALELRLAATMSPAPSRVSAWVSFVMSAGLLGTATYAAVKSRSEKRSLEQDLASSRLISSDDARIRSGWMHAIAADALFTLGGVTAALGLYYALRSPGPDSTIEVERRSLALVPSFGPGTLGVMGRF